MLDCSKYNKREGQSCDLNNLCRYPNCSQYTNHMKVIELFPDGRIGAYEIPEIPLVKKELLNEKGEVIDKHIEWHEYEQTLETARRNPIYFRPEDITVKQNKPPHEIWWDVTFKAIDQIRTVKQFECFSVPDRYEVKIEVRDVDEVYFELQATHQDYYKHHFHFYDSGKKTFKKEFQHLYSYATLILNKEEKERPATLVGDSLDASYFKGGERVNHFLVNALMQLSQDEIRILGENLLERVPKPPDWLLKRIDIPSKEEFEKECLNKPKPTKEKIDLTKNPELLHSYEQLYPKQQSIEEDAKEYASSVGGSIEGQLEHMNTFIAGAKSQEDLAIKFAEWIGQKQIHDSWFNYSTTWHKWYWHTKGHLTSKELFEQFKQQKP